MKKLEIACNSYQSCLNAYRGGADRIELFENLGDGGCTPSFGMMKKIKEDFPIPVYVMIRPRGGNFVYSDHEFEIMKYDIILCREVGVDGIVFGILDSNHEVDIPRCRELMSFWKHGSATFHRAIDVTRDINQAAENIIDLGFERILTSGGRPTALEGLDTIHKLKHRYGSKVSIMAGSGIDESNVHQFSVLQEIHATCKVEVRSESLFDSMTYSDETKIKKLGDKFKSI